MSARRIYVIYHSNNEEYETTMTATWLLAFDQDLADFQMGAQFLATDNTYIETQKKTTKYLQQLRMAKEDKINIMGKEEEVYITNEKLRSVWHVIKDINSPKARTTSKKRPQDKIRMIGLDFNKLPGADFLLVEVLLHLWPDKNAFFNIPKISKNDFVSVFTKKQILH